MAFGQPKKTVSQTEKREQKGDKCNGDLDCIADRLTFTAGFLCEGKIERLAKYDFKWTDGLLEPKFSRYRIKDREKRIIAVFGDKIQFQNGFGAMQNHIYECDIAADSNTVVGVKVTPGRL